MSDMEFDRTYIYCVYGLVCMLLAVDSIVTCYRQQIYRDYYGTRYYVPVKDCCTRADEYGSSLVYFKSIFLYFELFRHFFNSDTIYHRIEFRTISKLESISFSRILRIPSRTNFPLTLKKITNFLNFFSIAYRRTNRNRFVKCDKRFFFRSKIKKKNYGF